jgi:hypothetical protein
MKCHFNVVIVAQLAIFELGVDLGDDNNTFIFLLKQLSAICMYRLHKRYSYIPTVNNFVHINITST